ncbi:MAG: CDP-diglyceride synthetase [Microgenomates group bacterium GW2011_GWA2_44_7]|nr:MAG: CDP-diglyceride synthetase [Microgenomates group bacterium GW2011_GWA2_44_7]KKT78234.1 MAG: CDP-diglyceride synthetase [Microgenomates group bacterium GW2011_GWB1_44_8]
MFADFLKVIALFIFPLLLTSVFHHFVVIKRNLWQSLTFPVDFGGTINGERIFGPTKTFRGFVVTIVGASLVTYLTYPLLSTPNVVFYVPSWLIGALLGLGYSIGELPTSFLKRRFDIAPSQQVGGAKGVFFYLLEQVDSVATAVIVALLISNIPISTGIILFTMGSGFHVSIDAILYVGGYKKKLDRPLLLRKLLTRK